MEELKSNKKNFLRILLLMVLVILITVFFVYDRRMKYIFCMRVVCRLGAASRKDVEYGLADVNM